MPAKSLKSYAERSNKSLKEVEKVWDDVKKKAKSKFGKEDEHYWAYVNAVVLMRLGIKTPKKKKK